MRFNGLTAMSDFWRVVREFNPEGIEREANAHLELWVCGVRGSGKRTLVASLIGGGDPAREPGPFRIVDLEPDDLQLPLAGEPDLMIAVVRMDQDLAEASRQAALLYGKMRAPMILVFTHPGPEGTTRDQRNQAYLSFSFAFARFFRQQPSLLLPSPV